MHCLEQVSKSRGTRVGSRVVLGEVTTPMLRGGQFNWAGDVESPGEHVQGGVVVCQHLCPHPLELVAHARWALDVCTGCVCIHEASMDLPVLQSWLNFVEEGVMGLELLVCHSREGSSSRCCIEHETRADLILIQVKEITVRVEEPVVTGTGCLIPGLVVPRTQQVLPALRLEGESSEDVVLGPNRLCHKGVNIRHGGHVRSRCGREGLEPRGLALTLRQELVADQLVLAVQLLNDGSQMSNSGPETDGRAVKGIRVSEVLQGRLEVCRVLHGFPCCVRQTATIVDLKGLIHLGGLSLVQSLLLRPRSSGIRERGRGRRKEGRRIVGIGSDLV
jgi:hypothetical protein